MPSLRDGHQSAGRWNGSLQSLCTDCAWMEARLALLEAQCEAKHAELSLHVERLQDLPMLGQRLASLEARFEANQAKELSTLGQRLAALEDRIEANHSKLTANVQCIQEVLDVAELHVDVGGCPDQQTACVKRAADDNKQMEWPTAVSNQMIFDLQALKLEASVWDLSLFLGLPVAGIIGSMWISILIFINTGIQGVLCIVLEVVFSEADDYQSASIVWRANSGHSYQYASALGESMANRVCNGDGSLTIAGMQADNIEHASLYLTGFGPTKIGPLICTLMLLVWFLCQYAGLQQIFDHWLAFVKIPKSKETQFVLTNGSFRFEAISYERCWLVGIVLLVRLGILFWLTVSGAAWLARTHDVENIILNAVALTFVMIIDEILYDTCTPVTLKALRENTWPLPIHRLDKPYAQSLRPTLALVSGLLYLVVLYFSFGRGEWEDVIGLLDAMCGGDTRFIVGTNPATGVVIGFRGEEFDSATFDQKARGKGLSLSERVTSKLIRGDDDYEQFWASSWSDFKTKQSFSVREYVSEFGKCSDDPPMPHRAAVRFQLNDPHWSNCASLNESQCANGHSILRIACPIQCGCSEPIFGSFSIEGCPLSLCRQTEQFQQKLTSIGVHDIEKKVLDALHWHSYWASFEWALSASPDRLAAFNRLLDWTPSAVVNMFRQDGCMAIAGLVRRSSAPLLLHNFFCAELPENSWRRPLSPFCPESCRCPELKAANDRMFCPLPLPPFSIVACTGVDVIHLNDAPTSGCEEHLPAESNFAGFYACYPHARNGRHLYNYTDASNVVWEIRWERLLDWGGMFLGADAGLAGLTKWTLSSRQHPGDVLVRHYFVVSNASTPPLGRWFQLGDAGAAPGTCPRGAPLLKEREQYVHAPTSSTACPAGYTSVEDISECKKITSIAGNGIPYQYRGEGRGGCYSNWPRGGCFSWQHNVYFSTCNLSLPMSINGGSTICKASNTPQIIDSTHTNDQHSGNTTTAP